MPRTDHIHAVTEAVLNSVVGFTLRAHASRHRSEGADPLPFWEKIANVSGTNVAQISITGLNLASHKAYMLILWGKNNSNSGRLRLWFNGDSNDGNYRTQRVEFAGSGFSVTRDNNSRVCYTKKNYSFHATIVITRYAGYRSHSLIHGAWGAGDDLIENLNVIDHYPDANVTSIQLNHEQNNMTIEAILFRVSN